MVNVRKHHKRSSRLERSNIEFPLWRKKVDSSLFRTQETPIPGWAADMWSIDKIFPGKITKKDPSSQVSITFDGNAYSGNVTAYHPKNRRNKICRLHFDTKLAEELKQTFLMSFMRDLESRLRENTDNIEEEIPFWEFLDIEFDAASKTFVLNAHYIQKPQFPELFSRLAHSPVLKKIHDETDGKPEFRINKQDWRPRSEFEFEFGAENIIYTLIDTKNSLLYIGEAENLVRRFNAGHPSIPKWNFFRYDQLPPMEKQQRVAIERMLIRSYAAVLQNKRSIPTMNISDFNLTNDKIDL
jgi:hypothetical protein